MRGVKSVVVFRRKEQRFVRTDLAVEFFGDRLERIELLLHEKLVTRGGGDRSVRVRFDCVEGVDVQQATLEEILFELDELETMPFD